MDSNEDHLAGEKRNVTSIKCFNVTKRSPKSGLIEKYKGCILDFDGDL